MLHESEPQEYRQLFSLNFDDVMWKAIHTHPSRTPHQLAILQVDGTFAYGGGAKQHFASSSNQIFSIGPPLWFLHSPLIYWVEESQVAQPLRSNAAHQSAIVQADSDLQHMFRTSRLNKNGWSAILKQREQSKQSKQNLWPCSVEAVVN